MSLHHLAAHIQSQGRKGDTGLIHMSPAEINGLQHLAIAHGGSLTINPKTGLPEANFMKDWLPSILGGLTMLIPGVGIPMAMALAAGTTFGTSMAVGNSLNKSLLQGAAAGAGAGIGGALGGAGAAAAGEAGALTAKVATQGGAKALTTGATTALDVVGTAAAQQAANQAGPLALKTAAQQAATRVPVQTVNRQIFERAPTAIFDTATDFAGQGANIGKAAAGYPTTLGSAGASNVGSALYNPATALATRTPSQATQFFSTAMPTGGRLPVDQIPGLSTKAVEFTPGFSNQAIFKAAGPMEKLSLMKQGAGAEFASPEAAMNFAGNNYGKLLTLGTGAIGSSSMSDPYRPAPEVSTYKGPYLPTERTAQFPIGPEPWTDTSERQYFDDVNPYPGVVPYEPTKAAVGGLMGVAGDSYDDEAGQDGYADGGEVDQNKMATPDMSAIQQYVQSISQPQRPQVPEILRQLQASRAATGGTQQPTTGEHDYGFKPITVEKASPVQDAPATKQRVNGMEWLFSGGMMGKQAAPVPIVDEHQYTDISKYVYNPETQQMEIPLAVGGLTSLARGGSYLDGPGDGLSDSIPAMIGKNQPARLADGEFVISADVVSAIGGGSSKAGAKKLHAMMDRVRQSAHGTKKQVKKINDRKVLAA